MSEKKRRVGVKIASFSPITKAEDATQIDKSDTGLEWIAKPVNMNGLKNLVNGSTILPQCIRAYKQNIAGFGIGIRYKEDVEETPEMVAEYNKAERIIDLFTAESDTKTIFEEIIATRETYGTAYVEVIRNNAGEVVQLELITETGSMTKTKPLEYAEFEYFYNGERITRNKRFRKYRQEINGEVVYFKEFGDKRIMDLRSGDFMDGVARENQANEILEFTIGTEPYGEVRWIGQVTCVDGSRMAENLNNNYFRKGRHTPLMFIIKGGTLTDDSFAKLQGYIHDIEGENGQHGFLILEAEAADGRVDFDAVQTPEIEVKELANILQHDELFGNYMEANRKKIQSAFQLPDIYTAYTTDFNRATALMAMQVTEEQVFQPERISLGWILNNKLLNGYQFKYVEAYFKHPNLSNPDDLYKILSVCRAAGGLTPNKAKQIVYEAYGEVAEDYEGDWGNIPIGVNTGGASFDVNSLIASFDSKIQKASLQHEDEIVAVLKEMRKYLKESRNNV